MCSSDLADVVCVDEAVSVDVAYRNVVEVRVATAQAGIVHVRGEVVLVNLAVLVDVALISNFAPQPEACFALCKLYVNFSCIKYVQI